MTNSAVAVYDTSYTNRVPYLSTAEMLSAPTAQDLANLLPGGVQANTTALVETIARASSWVDQYTMGSYGTLACTQNTENARVWGNQFAQLRIHPRFWPILEVSAFSFSAQGFATGSAASITPAGNIWIEPQQFIVQVGGVAGLGFGSNSLGFGSPPGIASGQQYYCVWQYTNGYPVSTLSASVAATAASIAPESVIGIYPGTTLTLYDLPNDEQVQVAATYVTGTTPVPLTSGLQFNHASGVMVTNLPPAVKQATIWATVAFLKQRGSGALVASDMGATTKQQTGFSQGAGSDWKQAKDLLQPLRAVFVGY